MKKPPTEGPSAIVRGCITANFPAEAFTTEQLRAKLPPGRWGGLRERLQLMVKRGELKTHPIGYQRA